jgi:hypothetical protein
MAAPYIKTITSCPAPPALYYGVNMYDSSCNFLGGGIVISNSGALNIGYYYATNELPGNIIQVLAMTSTYPDYFTNINTPGYGQCGDVPPL